MNEQPTDGAPLTKGKGTRAIREDRFIGELLAGKDQGQAALDAGYGGNLNSASVTASRKLGDPNFQLRVRERMFESGMGIDFGIDNLRALLKADTYGLGGREKDTPILVGPDSASRVKALDQYWRIVGAYPDPRADVQVNAAVTVVLRSADSLAVDPFADGPAIDGEAREIEGGTDGLP